MASLLLAHRNNKEHSSTMLPSLWTEKIKNFFFLLLSSDLVNDSTCHIAQGCITETPAANSPQAVACTELSTAREQNAIMFSLWGLVANWLTLSGWILRFSGTQWHASSLCNHKKQGPCRDLPTELFKGQGPEQYSQYSVDGRLF